MLIYLYLFSLIVGGVLLAASVLLGGHDDADLDMDGDADLDGDLDHGGAHAFLDADFGDADVDSDTEAGMDKDLGGHGDTAGVFLFFLSLRFWTFFLAFFGLTGMLLDGLDLVSNPIVALVASLLAGGMTGLGAVSIIRYFAKDQSGVTASSQDYIGKTARVMVPMEGQGIGKIRVQIRGADVDLLASSIEEQALSGREEVLIVEMDGTRAKVARLEKIK